MPPSLLPSLVELRLTPDGAATDAKRKRASNPVAQRELDEDARAARNLLSFMEDGVLSDSEGTARHLVTAIRRVKEGRWSYYGTQINNVDVLTGFEHPDTVANPYVLVNFNGDAEPLEILTFESEFDRRGNVFPELRTFLRNPTDGKPSYRLFTVDEALYARDTLFLIQDRISSLAPGDRGSYRLNLDNIEECAELPEMPYYPVFTYNAAGGQRSLRIVERESPYDIVDDFNEHDARRAKFGGLYHPLNRFLMFRPAQGGKRIVPLAEPVGDDALPPGWEERRNNSGDAEYYYDGLGLRPSKFTFSKSQAWQFFNSGHGRQFGDLERLRQAANPGSMDVQSDGGGSACGDDGGDEGAFGSLSKRLHRERVVRHLAADACATGRASVVFLGSPDMADARYFQSRVDAGALPSSVVFHAVNRGEFVGDADGLRNVSFHPGVDLLAFLETQEANAHTLVWMDLTSTDVTYRELAAGCLAARETVMLVLSLRTATMKTTTPVVETMSAALGTTITHIENYQGLSGKRNMAFYELDCSNYRHRSYRDEFDSIGMLVYTIADKRTPEADFRLTCRGVQYVMNMCLDFDVNSNKFTILAFDSTRRLQDKRLARQVDGSEIATSAPHIKTYLDGLCG